MANKSILDLDYAKYDFKDPEKYVFKSEKGLSRQTVEQISEMKKEPEWMLKFRLRAYEHFVKRPMPMWGGDLAHIDFNDIYYYLRPTDKVEKSWDDVPDKIKKTFNRWGIPEAAKMGQFERTLIIADNYADVQYIEGCTAPVYSKDALHSAVVEIIAKKGAKVRYTTLQNWSSDVYNLVTKRAYAYEDASVEWIDANVGSKLTMKYPSVYLVGPRAKAEIVSVAFAGKDRHQDTGAKVIHLAPYTSSRITAKSVSKDGGLTTYRGLVHVAKGAVGVKSSVRCDALLMDDRSKTTTYPYMEINEDDATITHEATVGRINEDQLFYLMSRGLSETQALSMIVTGFMEPFTRVLPMEYAVEFNRLIEMEMEGAVG